MLLLPAAVIVPSEDNGTEGRPAIDPGNRIVESDKDRLVIVCGCCIDLDT